MTTLDDRLAHAREEYRDLERSAPGPSHLRPYGTPRAAGRGPHRGRWVVAAAALVARSSRRSEWC